MQSNSLKVLPCCLVAFLLSGCSTVDNSQQPKPQPAVAKVVQVPQDDPLHIPASQIDVNAKSFMHSTGVGELIAKTVDKHAQKEAVSNPSVAELARRAFAKVSTDDYENLAAKVYTKHLSKPVLQEMANFTNTSAGGRFFRSVFASIGNDKPINEKQLMSQFNADELTVIMKFALSDTFATLKSELPAINKDLEEEGKKLGEAAMRQYLKSSP